MRLWINNIAEERFISVEEAGSYLDSGWCKGRIASHKPPLKKKTLPEKTYTMRSPQGNIHTVTCSVYQMKKDRLKRAGWKFVRKSRSLEFKQRMSEKISNMIWISSPDRRKRVNQGYVEKYIKRGWCIGMKYSLSSAEYEFTLSDYKFHDMPMKLSLLRSNSIKELDIVPF